MSAKLPDEPGPIAAAAHAVEVELAHIETSAATALRLPLTSQRNLDKAVRAVDEAADGQMRVGQHIQALMAALNAARDRNQATATSLEARRAELRAKLEQQAQLVARFQEIGQKAKDISDIVRVVGAARPEERASTVPQLDQIDVTMKHIVEEAQVLVSTAREAGFDDLAQQVEGLRQQVHAARNKVSLLATRLRT